MTDADLRHIQQLLAEQARLLSMGAAMSHHSMNRVIAINADIRQMLVTPEGK